MAQVVQVLGVKQVITNLRTRHLRMAAGFSRGLKLAGLMLQRESMTKVPVDTGNLKASAFTRSSGSLWQTEVRVGYTAAYGLYVHEAVEMKLRGQDRTTAGKYWDPIPRAGAKFLEEPARTMRLPMRKVISQSIRAA